MRVFVRIHWEQLQRYIHIHQCSYGIANYNQSCYNLIDDIDECKDESYDCPSSADCTNTHGSYYCICTNGTKIDNKGNCTGIGS